MFKRPSVFAFSVVMLNVEVLYGRALNAKNGLNRKLFSIYSTKCPPMLPKVIGHSFLRKPVT